MIQKKILMNSSRGGLAKKSKFKTFYRRLRPPSSFFSFFASFFLAFFSLSFIFFSRFFAFFSFLSFFFSFFFSSFLIRFLSLVVLLLVLSSLFVVLQGACGLAASLTPIDASCFFRLFSSSCSSPEEDEEWSSFGLSFVSSTGLLLDDTEASATLSRKLPSIS